MAFNGSGTFLRLYNWVNDAAAKIKIRADRLDAEMDGMATGLSTCITKNGQTTITANLPMSGYKHTGVANGSARTEYAALGQLQDGLINWIDSGGSADAITATYSPSVTSLSDGQLFFVRAGYANATTTPTFSPDGLTARTIVKNGGAALVAGDIYGDGHELVLRYNLANTRYELLNPSLNSVNVAAVLDPTLTALSGLATGANKVPYSTGTDTFGQLDFLDEDTMTSDSATAVASQQSIKAYVDAQDAKFKAKFLHLQDQKSAGTDGGGFTSGAWRTRTLTTKVTDEISSTLSSNQFTLPAGTYYIDASAPAFSCNLHKLKLCNITDASDVLIGTAAYSSNGSYAVTRSFVSGRFTIASTKTFEIQHQCSLTRATDGLGLAAGFSVTEIYTDVKIWTVA